MAEHTKGPYDICEAGAYSDFDNTGIVILGDNMSRRVAVFHHDVDAQHWNACVNALEGYNPDAVRDVVEALGWYQEQTSICRLLHSEGDAGRNALSADVGKRARTALARLGGAS